jgi:Carboxypeptidase regulatory-like domain
MMLLLAPLLAALFFPQAQAGRVVSGEVVDGQGKAVAGAQVVFCAHPAAAKRDAVEALAVSDSQGAFRLNVPKVGPALAREVNFLAYRPGLALGAVGLAQRPDRIVLREPRPRTVKIVGADGEAVSGARIAPRMIYVFGGTLAEIPESLGGAVAARTESDGTATITYLAARDQLVAVRVTDKSIGAQDFLLVEQPGRSSEPNVITIRLKSTGKIVGRLVDQDGKGVAGRTVQAWLKGGAEWVPPSLVGFKDGPPRTAADGSFQTPDNLMIGSTYRLSVREPDQEPIDSDWITIREKTRVVRALVSFGLRTIRGRVVDREGKPVANCLVFQTGDGPRRTETETDSDGRFALGGLRPGSVFLFARRDGFRFHGQLIKASERNVTVEMTGTTERPVREMRMLPDPIPLEESRALARRLVEPCWKAVAEKGDDAQKYFVLASLVPADPAGVLEKLEAVKFQVEAWRFRILREIVPALAERDFEEAAAVAESIADPGSRSSALIRLADSLPATQRDRKLAMLDRALPQARIAADQSDRLRQMGDVADRWYELGEIDRAKALLAEGLVISKLISDKTDFRRGAFAAQLARADLPAALLIAKDFAGQRLESSVLGNIAYRLAAENPVEAERIWILTKRMTGTRHIDPALARKLGSVDPARARRALEEMPWIDQRPYLFLYLALGARLRNEPASRQAFEIAIQGIDRILRERPERYLPVAGSALPAVERIDPALVGEVLWRDVASRTPVVDPRVAPGSIPGRMIAYLAWYDREVAAALFEPTRVRMEETSDPDLAAARFDFLEWSLIDPRAAVARLERTPINPLLAQITRNARLMVAASLGRSHENRWSEIWPESDIILGRIIREL